ncbi:MAG TPA: type II secretion system F family protein [Xanthobacteraceae bacterium]|nr:type II secretion system F family protein [Xanthobacteraceae bacterium]
MRAILDLMPDISADDPIVMLSLLVFLAAATLAFGVMATIHVRGAVKRRAAEVTADGPERADDKRSLRYASRQAAQKLLDYTTRHYSGGDDGDKRQLRQRLLQAGFLDPRAVAFFFIARLAAAVVFGGVGFVLAPMMLSGPDGMTWMVAWVAGLLGYFAPNIYVNRRIAARQVEHRTGFPDFMDLLVVCADAGLSMEAALDRVGRELGDSYPSLSANIYMTTLEMRAGRTLSEALEHFGDRLGLEEARSFATLLQQSEELGSSLTEALRVYSDDMRHKRMSRAEEKAYSLPARLSVPLMVCIFPVILIVIMLPVYVRFKMGAY